MRALLAATGVPGSVPHYMLVFVKLIGAVVTIECDTLPAGAGGGA